MVVSRQPESDGLVHITGVCLHPSRPYCLTHTRTIAIDPHLAIFSSALIAAIGITVDAQEQIAARPQIAAAFEWRILATSRTTTLKHPQVSRILDALTTTSGTLVFQGGRILLAWLLVAAMLEHLNLLAGMLAILLVAMQLTLQARYVYGLDGADQMFTVVLAGVAIEQTHTTVGLWFVAAQSLMSYEIAGLAKMAGKEWRNGNAPSRILGTLTHGSRWAHRLTKHLWVSRILAWLTIGFEVAGPIGLLAGAVPIGAFVAAAVLFHVGIAATMGLNNFVWAFGAALPAVIWLAFEVAH